MPSRQTERLFWQVAQTARPLPELLCSAERRRGFFLSLSRLHLKEVDALLSPSLSSEVWNDCRADKVVDRAEKNNGGELPPPNDSGSGARLEPGVVSQSVSQLCVGGSRNLLDPSLAPLTDGERNPGEGWRKALASSSPAVADSGAAESKREGELPTAAIAGDSPQVASVICQRRSSDGSRFGSFLGVRSHLNLDRRSTSRRPLMSERSLSPRRSAVTIVRNRKIHLAIQFYFILFDFFSNNTLFFWLH